MNTGAANSLKPDAKGGVTPPDRDPAGPPIRLSPKDKPTGATT
ncbi:MAG: hypothetical protein R3C45_22100 [Phycisphaerales bacterium]